MATKTKGFFSRIADALDGVQAGTIRSLREQLMDQIRKNVDLNHKLLKEQQNTVRLTRWLLANANDKIRQGENAVEMAIRLLEESRDE